VRIYVPATLAGLAGYLRSGAVPSTAERFVAPDDSEESEYAALEAAAVAAVGLLDGPGRRVVLVAEVADEDAAVPLDRLEAVHADTEPVDPAARDLPDLAWFATQEIEDLLAAG
jgi:hypothetical protein